MRTINSYVEELEGFGPPDPPEEKSGLLDEAGNEKEWEVGPA